MFCWGKTENGQLGCKGTEDGCVFQPLQLNFDGSWKLKDVVSGENHTLMVLYDGQIWSCGSNKYGQLGRNKATKTLGHGYELEFIRMPTLIESLESKKVIQIACGLEHSMALTDTGEIYSWGNVNFGQLGLGPLETCIVKPQLVKSLVGIPISYIVCGGYHSFAVSKSGAVFGWGRNDNGQLGLGDRSHRVTPYLLSSLEDQKIVYMCCGRDHSVALNTVSNFLF